jgi:NitT/TauT family transport system substrate-binding protein/sulfonate transport system substrate-binding protein
MPTHRHRFRLAAAATLLLAGATACTSADADSANSTTLRIGYIGTNDTLTGPLGYLLSTKQLVSHLKAAGITGVKTYNFANGPDLNQALAAGDLDVGVYGDTPALVARGAGQPTRLLGQAQVGLDAEIVTKKGGPTSLAALTGQTVAVAKGSYMHRYLLGALGDAHASPSQVLNIPTADTPAALAKGDIAAAALPIANAEALRAQGYPVIDDLVRDHPNYAGTTVEVATEGYLKSHPKFVSVWQATHRFAAAQAKAHWDAYLRFAHTLSSFPPAVIDATTKAEQYPDTSFTDRGLQLLEGTQKFLVDAELEAKSFPIDGWVADGAK